MSRLDQQLQDNEYIVGDVFTMADISAFIAVDFAAWSRISIEDKMVNLHRWYKLVSVRPSVQFWASCLLSQAVESIAIFQITVAIHNNCKAPSSICISKCVCNGCTSPSRCEGTGVIAVSWHWVSRECVISDLSLIHIWRCRRSYACRSRWSPYH